MALHGRFAEHLSVQTVLPPDFATSASFRRTAEGMRDLGLWGVELNIKDLEDPRTRAIAEVRDYLADFDLKLASFASGLTAKTLGASLSAVGEGRGDAVRLTRRIVDWVAGGSEGGPASGGEETGIIIGFLKGPVAPDPAAARRSLVASLVELAPYAAGKGVPLILEATNRYETSVVNRVAEGVEIIDEVAASVGRERLGLPKAASAESGGPSSEVGAPILQLLPDTFHMNIEEANVESAMAESFAYFTSFHLSDNNRFFPGFGAIDFKKIVGVLRDLDYRGRFAIEGNLKGELLDDLRRSLDYLSPILG